MILFFFWFILYAIHIHFLLLFLLFDIEGAQFFQWYVPYRFDRAIAVESLVFVFLCGLSFTFAYKASYFRTSNRERFLLRRNSYDNNPNTNLMNFFALVPIVYIAIVAYKAGLDYGEMTKIRAGFTIIFELRIVYLLLLSYLLLNVSPSAFFFGRRYLVSRLVLLTYIFSLILFQSRSTVFEVGIVIAFALLLWNGDRIKIRYIFILFGSLCIPNMIILGRFNRQVFDTPVGELIGQLFTIEYSVFLNNILGAVINSGWHSNGDFSFSAQIGVVIPSIIRQYLGIHPNGDPIIEEFAILAGSYGGGFSVLGQLYYDFGWATVIVFGVLGLIIGSLTRGAAMVGGVRIFYATAPLVFTMFLLSLRNDFGTLVKYIIQVLVISQMLRFFPGFGFRFKAR